MTAPAVVVDSACLIALERIGRLDLLPAVFSEVLAPPAVRDEFGRSLPWVTFRPISSELPVTSLRTQLHRGEAEAIALAAESGSHLILLDDKKARRIAREVGLRPIGTVGVILRAKREGIIPACKPLLDALVGAGFHLSESFYQEALRLAGEADEVRGAPGWPDSPRACPRGRAPLSVRLTMCAQVAALRQ